MDFSSLLGSAGGFGGGGSQSSPGGGGAGGAATSSANSSQSWGNDVYGSLTPAAPPGQSKSWLLPAVIGGVGLLLVLVFAIKK